MNYITPLARANSAFKNKDFDGAVALYKIAFELAEEPMKGIIDFNIGIALRRLEKTCQMSERSIEYNVEGVKVAGGSVIVHGWVVDPNRILKSILLTADCSKGTVEIMHKMLKFERSDVVKAYGSPLIDSSCIYGFVIIVDHIPDLQTESKINICFKCENDKIYRGEYEIVNVLLNQQGLENLFGILPVDRVTAEACSKFYRPIFTVYTQQQQPAVEKLDRLYPIDATPSTIKPLLSVIIPLYGSTRFELTQIPQLAALRRQDWEIIFAVDDPSILKTVQENVQRLARNFGVVIRMVAPDRNLGFSGINNFAATRANGENLLFLNSDCFITTAGPVDSALAWLKNSANGAAGFRLLYANDSIQHDGMSVSKWDEGTDFYLNDHPRIGTPSEWMSVNIKHDTACLLTAACLMMRKKLFLDVGGFDISYLRGDFEDSDLCMKLLASGKRLGIVRQPGLYHLERQSIMAQAGHMRQKITLVNSNIYSQRWKQCLSKPIASLEVIQ